MFLIVPFPIGLFEILISLWFISFSPYFIMFCAIIQCLLKIRKLSLIYAWLWVTHWESKDFIYLQPLRLSIQLGVSLPNCGNWSSILRYKRELQSTVELLNPSQVDCNIWTYCGKRHVSSSSHCPNWRKIMRSLRALRLWRLLYIS